MKKDSYRLISIIIAFSILITVGIQSFWSYKNYQENKRLFVNELQDILDGAVDTYYTNLAKDNVLEFDRRVQGQVNLNVKDSFRILKPDSAIARWHIQKPDSSQVNKLIIITDSGEHQFSKINEFKRLIAEDSLSEIIKDSTVNKLKVLTSKIIISLQTDTVNMTKLDSIFLQSLKRRSIAIDYQLHVNNNAFYDYDRRQRIKANTLHAASSFLPGRKLIILDYQDETPEIVKRSFVSIMVSLLVTLGIIGSLIYLYRVIKNQKELAIIKNDLINNITHEFKTPIATVMTALEGIQNFNSQKDPEKTKKYIDVSNQQLKKLTHMVEHLLETATLETDNFVLNPEEVNLSEMITGLVEKFSLLAPEKQIHIKVSDLVYGQVDPFHIENAISNILDNAIKYGGPTIWVTLSREEALHITISDDGPGIKKNNRKKIFEKFYRVSTGDVHNVKGYGIGLYYTSRVVARHGGSILLDCSNGQTTFKIILP